LTWHACGFELRGEELDVLLLVLCFVPLGVGGLGELSWGKVPGVPAGDVGGDTADGLGATGVLVDGGEFLGSGLCGTLLVMSWPLGGDGSMLTQVVVPAEPASVTSIDIHGDVWHVELLQGICDALTVARGRVLAGLEVGVGDQVGQGIGLDDESDGSVGVLLEDGNDG
jgi:hypothetical protein